MKPEVLLDRVEVALYALERLNADEQDALTDRDADAIDAAITRLVQASERIEDCLAERGESS